MSSQTCHSYPMRTQSNSEIQFNDKLYANFCALNEWQNPHILLEGIAIQSLLLVIISSLYIRITNDLAYEGLKCTNNTDTGCRQKRTFKRLKCAILYNTSLW